MFNPQYDARSIQVYQSWGLRQKAFREALSNVAKCICLTDMCHGMRLRRVRRGGGGGELGALGASDVFGEGSKSAAYLA
jgi:hypothetical protein